MSNPLQEPLIPPPNLVSPVADAVRRCFSQFSWAAGLLPPPVTTTHSMTLDELDTSMESTSLDLSQQRSYSGQQDHVINFYTSQSDPINRGELGCMSLLDSRLCSIWLYKYYNV